MTDFAAIPLASSSQLVRSRFARILIVLAVFTFPAVLLAVLAHLRFVALGQPSTLWKWIADQLCEWYGWAAWTPLIFALGRKFRLERIVWRRHLAIHVAVSLGVSAVQACWKVMASIVIMGDSLSGLWIEFVKQWVWTGPILMLIYFAILGVAHALDYYVLFKEREVRASQLEAEVAQAHLDSLQRQIQPHFLFNALNSITVLVQKGEASAAEKTLLQLSALLRRVLKEDSAPTVPLSEEIEFATRYLEIEKTRFGDRLEYRFNIPPELLGVPVPGFVIQPLVENAVRHGTARRIDTGHIIVSAIRNGQRITIVVADNGSGGSMESDASNAGIGLKNIKHRLTYLYGDDHRLELSRTTVGTTVIVEIPHRSEPT